MQNAALTKTNIVQIVANDSFANGDRRSSWPRVRGEPFPVSREDKMPRYRITLINGQSWITDHYKDRSDAANALSGQTGGGVLEFRGVVEEARVGEMNVLVSHRHVASFEEQ